MADPDHLLATARNPPSTQRAFLPSRSGAVSGIAVDFIFFPLDTVKTRVQSTRGFWASGGFSGVYRGVGSVGMGSAPGAAAFFVTYETLKSQIPRVTSALASQPGLNHMVAASGAEFVRHLDTPAHPALFNLPPHVSCLIRVPTEIVKSRTQTGAYGEGRNSLHSLVSTWRYEGLRGFYRGFGITIARELPFTSVQFPLYEALKSQLSERYLSGRRPSPGEAAACGMIAGGVAGAATTPLDVVKTRVMLEAKTTIPNGTSPSQRIPSPSILSFPPRLLEIFRKEGARALFGGWIPRTVAISLGGAVFLGIYDFTVNFGRDDPMAAQSETEI